MHSSISRRSRLVLALIFSSAFLTPLHTGTVPSGTTRNPRENLALHAPHSSGVIFTQVSKGASSQTFDEGGRVVFLSRSGELRVLTGEFQSAADPAVSFDGKRILFAAKRKQGDLWNIFEMQADGSEVRQITKAMGNCRKPIYQPAIFYLDDPLPSYQIAFVSDLEGTTNELSEIVATNLYSIRMDGSGLRRLTYGMSSSYDPFQMQDGRILYSSLQNSKLENGRDGRVDLFAVHIDGTDVGTFSGTQGLRFKRMACTTPNRKAVFVESEQNSADVGGTLATIDLRRNLRSYKQLTFNKNGSFAWPSPLPDGTILVSMRAPDKDSGYAVYWLDIESGRQSLVYSDAKNHAVQAVVLSPRPEPDGHSSVVEDDKNWSKLYCLSTSITELDREWLKPGTAKRVRLVEGLPRAKANASDSLSGLAIKRLLGEAEIEEDGSLQFLVPPNTPMQLQILDENGIALRTSAWMWTKNKENRGCIGCHEDGELSPENVFPEALGKPAADLMLAPERRRTVDFERDIMPILQAKCVSCHRPQDTSIAVEGFPKAYAELLFGVDDKGRGKFVDPGRARTSRVIWAIYGKNTSRPWDSVTATGQIKPMPPAGSPQLSEEEKRAIAEWIDLGAQFKPVPSHPVQASTSTRGQQ
jgi:hypothetical protein